jgi:hypothetical protein
MKMAVSSTANKTEATESKCALPMFIADRAAFFIVLKCLKNE